MKPILIAISTTDGHTMHIGERLRGVLQSRGLGVTLKRLADCSAADVDASGAVVVGASIRYGKHRPHVYEFVEANRGALEGKPSAFFSVNVVARKPGKDTPEGNPYMRKFRRKSRWTPAVQGVFAGRIDYALYGPLDRLVIRFIMWLTRGPTDPRASVEFTHWPAVDAFARRVSAM
jgi:menaquinone-dependent protoporphyrinogen oxidase